MRAKIHRAAICDPEKRAVRVALREAVRAKKIIKPKVCEDCGQELKLHGHHHDYSQPLSVRWLCIMCHRKAHGKKVIARAALAEAALAAGETISVTPETAARMESLLIGAGMETFDAIAAVRKHTKPAPPAAPEPETIDLMQALKDRLAKLASERVELTPLQRECMQQAVYKSAAPEPQREEPWDCDCWPLGGDRPHDPENPECKASMRIAGIRVPRAEPQREEPEPWPAYDRDFGDGHHCACGHTYRRHFDTYDNMAPVGCKYCDCGTFKLLAAPAPPAEEQDGERCPCGASGPHDEDD